MTASVFGRFSPRLQEAIVSRLGWASLRTVQELAGTAILDGKNAVVLAPTAGGKTEASLFPILSMLMEHQQAGVGAVYLAPIKALLNNQAERLGQYTEMVGLRRFLWHGDIHADRRRKFVKDPADLLMTTPESLEVMLASPKVPVDKVFRDLRVVVIDEVHALAGTDRGAHMMSVIERIVDQSRHDVQRVGLSATVGDPGAIARWIQGTSKRESVVVDPPKEPVRRQIAIHLEPDPEALARRAGDSARGKKSLFFCESRRLTEAVADGMRDRGTDVFVHHSSVSLSERKIAEARFSGGGSAAIVCTSTLELGIDVGDLDHVFQGNAPATVSSFLQRMGRTGRRPNTVMNMTFFCEEPESVLQAIALVELARSGWVEPIPPQARCWPVLVHQVLALALSAGALSRSLGWEKLSRVPDLSGISRFEFDQLIDHMVVSGYLFESSGMLSMGQTAERRYGRYNFLELYSVFSSPQLYSVEGPGGVDIGSLQQDFVDALVEGMTSFLLGGRAWMTLSIDHRNRVVNVSPAPRGKVPKWGGMVPTMLGFDVCQRIKAVLCETTQYPYVSDVAADAVRAFREEMATLLEQTNALQLSDDGARWWTYAGGRINQTLRFAIAELTGWKVSSDNFHLRMEGDGISNVSMVQIIEQLATPEFWDNAELWQKIIARVPAYRLSKFQDALPARFQLELLGRYLLDLDGARRFVLGDAATDPSQRAADLLNRVISTFPTSEPEPSQSPYAAALQQHPGSSTARPKHPIRFIDASEPLAALCAELRLLPAIALDVETTLVERNLCLIQIGVQGYNAVIDPRAAIDLDPLCEILESATIIKVIHNASFERSVLLRSNIRLANVFDTLTASRRIRGRQLEGHSLLAVCRRELDRVLDKRHQTSDWTRRPLSEDQISYAALDVEVLLELHAVFIHVDPQVAELPAGRIND